MANKLKNEELENVTGGSCSRKYCGLCKQQFSGNYWIAHYKGPAGEPLQKIVCPTCYKQYQNDPRYTWEYKD